ncbi:MAG TPA: glucose-6-phosphate dehydrogenase assembly protein OpcA [Bryobacteraceae bacterium]|nr:glucose-6-phosphate dehydrogenase assembly protein OpcA [Bryobacteraceae bacterium]
MTSTTIQPETLLKELHELWASLAREKNPQGLLRACSMTLFIITEDGQDTAAARRIAGNLMRAHPSRIIIIEVATGARLQGRVFAECHRGAGGNDQICSEGVEIVAGAAQFGELACLAAPLVTPDLPVMMWCRGPRVFSSSDFEPLFALARKIIVDSCSAPDAPLALAAIKRMRAHQQIADLSWTRLTGWREALAHRLEAKAADPAGIRFASIRYGRAAEPCAHYLKYWILRAAPLARIDLEPVSSAEGVHAVSVSCAEAEITVSASEARAARRNETELICEELSIAGPDPVFDDLLSRI